jgi:sulfofructose kinase
VPRMTFPPRLPAQRAFDVVGLGANACDTLLIIPHHPDPGEKVRFRRVLRQGGGQTATALATVARLGHSASYLGGVGDDEAGALSLAQLRAEGVEVEGVRVRAGGLSQQAYILVDATTGERTIAWGRSEGMILEPGEIERAKVTAGRILHTDAQQPLTAARAARWAREAGMPVLADLEPVRPGLEAFLPHVDILIAAEEFPGPATGAGDLGEALRVLEERTRGGWVMVTRGPDGVVARIDGCLRTYPAFAIEAVDTTGAGDVFHGAFAVACLRGLALEEAIDFSHAVAAMKCLALGGRTGIPRSWEDVERFRRETPRRPARPT